VKIIIAYIDMKGVITINHENEPLFVVLLESVIRKISTTGLPIQEFNEIKNFPIGYGKLEEFVKANVGLGNYEWKKGKLYNSERFNYLDLDDKHLESLRLRAIKAGMSEAELAGKLIAEILDIRLPNV